MKQVYMDYAAGKPIDGRVLEEMIPYFSQKFGNPSSAHTFSSIARDAIEEARGKVAQLIGAEQHTEIVFTSGGTESNNLAIKGAALRNVSQGNHIVTSSIEHMSVINPCKYLSTQGFDVTYLPVDEHGFVDLDALSAAISAKTVLVSIAWANGEIGTVEPIAEIGELVHSHGALFHVDAVAAAGQVPIDVRQANVDLLSLTSNDLYGPRGVGALYVKAGARIQPLFHGGGQERGLRSGTENLPGIVGMGRAAELAHNEQTAESDRLTGLRDRLIEEAVTGIPEAYLNGPPRTRLPNNANMRFSYIEGESLILSLDMEGVICSSGSACSSKTLEPSHVLLAIGLKHEEAHGSLLFTLGRRNDEGDLKYVLTVLPRVVRRLRRISPLTPKELIQ